MTISWSTSTIPHLTGSSHPGRGQWMSLARVRIGCENRSKCIRDTIHHSKVTFNQYRQSFSTRHHHLHSNEKDDDEYPHSPSSDNMPSQRQVYYKNHQHRHQNHDTTYRGQNHPIQHPMKYSISPATHPKKK